MSEHQHRAHTQGFIAFLYFYKTLTLLGHHISLQQSGHLLSTSAQKPNTHNSHSWKPSASPTLAFPKSTPFFTGELNGTLLWLPQLTKIPKFPCHCKSKLRIFLNVVIIFCSWEPWGHRITLCLSSILSSVVVYFLNSPEIIS